MHTGIYNVAAHSQNWNANGCDGLRMLGKVEWHQVSKKNNLIKAGGALMLLH